MGLQVLRSLDTKISQEGIILPVIRDLAQQKESRVWEGHLMPDHAHILVSIPPKYAVAQVVGYIKGKSAIYVARNFGNRRKNFTGERFWAKGYCVSTVGLDEEKIRKYVKWQLEKDKRMEQLKLWH
mgnify:CR=1 FL=1